LLSEPYILQAHCAFSSADLQPKKYNEAMRILVVEDEHRIATSIKKGLEQERYAVDVAFTGVEGFDLASTEDYDAMILDLMLPEMDGMQICKQLREKGNHTPILMLTARGQVQDRVEGLNAGADDYLTKPFSFEELLARVKALIRRPKGLLNMTLTVGDLQLDTQAFEVKRGETRIKLSNKEFALLEYLLRHANQITSKQQIVSHVWDYESNILPNTVEVYIRNLRQKIDHPFPHSTPLIHTVRGFGYKIGE
jgi:DNA-binding response OmpR family regulator